MVLYVFELKPVCEQNIDFMVHCIFLVDLFLLYYTNYRALCALTIYPPIQKLIMAWIGVLVVNILTAQILSLIHILGRSHAWLVCHAIYLFGIFVLLYGKGLFALNPLGCIQWKDGFHQIIKPLKTAPLWVRLLGFICLLSIILLVPLHGMHSQPINDDAVGYHLPRVQQYIHQNSLEAFTTSDSRQTDFPLNYEIIMIWVLTISNDLRWIYCFQWLMVGSAVLSLYITCRFLVMTKISTHATVLLWLATPFVILQLSFVKNDVMMSCLVVYTLPFLIRISNSFYINTVVISLCLGMAVGVKYTGLFYLASLFLVLLCLLMSQRNSFKKIAYLTLVFTLSMILLGSYSYFSTWDRTNSPFTSHPGKTHFRLQSIPINSLRLAMETTDSVTLPNELYARMFHQELPDIRAPLLNAIKTIPLLNVDDEESYWAWMKGNKTFDLKRRYFQFTLGHLFFLLIGLIFACKNWKKEPVKLILGFFFIAYIMQTAILKWQPVDNLRFYFPLLSVLYPFIGFYLDQHVYRNRILHGLALTSVGIGLVAIFYYLYIMV